MSTLLAFLLFVISNLHSSAPTVRGLDPSKKLDVLKLIEPSASKLYFSANGELTSYEELRGQKWIEFAIHVVQSDGETSRLKSIWQQLEAGRTPADGPLLKMLREHHIQTAEGLQKLIAEVIRSSQRSDFNAEKSGILVEKLRARNMSFFVLDPRIIERFYPLGIIPAPTQSKVYRVGPINVEIFANPYLNPDGPWTWLIPALCQSLITHIQLSSALANKRIRLTQECQKIAQQFSTDGSQRNMWIMRKALQALSDLQAIYENIDKKDVVVSTKSTAAQPRIRPTTPPKAPESQPTQQLDKSAATPTMQRPVPAPRKRLSTSPKAPEPQPASTYPTRPVPKPRQNKHTPQPKRATVVDERTLDMQAASLAAQAARAPSSAEQRELRRVFYEGDNFKAYRKIISNFNTQETFDLEELFIFGAVKPEKFLQSYNTVMRSKPLTVDQIRNPQALIAAVRAYNASPAISGEE